MGKADSVAELPGLCFFCEKRRTKEKFGPGPDMYLCDGCVDDLRCGRIDPRDWMQKCGQMQQAAGIPHLEADYVLSSHLQTETRALQLLLATVNGRGQMPAEAAERMQLCSQAFELARDFHALSAEVLAIKRGATR